MYLAFSYYSNGYKIHVWSPWVSVSWVVDLVFKVKFYVLQDKWSKDGMKVSKPWRRVRKPFSPFLLSWPMASLDPLQLFHPMPLFSLMWSCCLGTVSKTYARMGEFSRKYLLKGRNGKIQKTWMKFLVNYWSGTSSWMIDITSMNMIHCFLTIWSFCSLQLSMKLGLKMGHSFRNLMGWNSLLKMVCLHSSSTFVCIYVCVYTYICKWTSQVTSIFILAFGVQAVSALLWQKLWKQWRKERKSS